MAKALFALHLIVAAAVAAAAASVILVVLHFLVALLATGEPAALVLAPFVLLFGIIGSPEGWWAAVSFATPTLLVLGGWLWMKGRTSEWARRRSAWAGIGATVGFGYAIAFALRPHPQVEELRQLAHLSQPLSMLLFVPTGSVTAVVFRAGMLTARLFSDTGADEGWADQNA